MRYFLLSVTVLAVACLLLPTQHVVEGQSQSVKQRKEKRLADCTLESKAIGDCDPVNYGIRVAVFAAPGIIVGLFMLLACPFYCAFKYCCNCCGGRNQSPNFCCPNKELPARYSVGDILRPKLLALVCFLFILSGMIWGMVGTTKMVSGLTNFGVAAKSIPDILGALIDEIDAALVVTRYDSTTDTTTQERLLSSSIGGNVKADAEKVKNDMKKNIDGVINDFQKYIDEYNIYIYIFFAVPAALVFLGVFAAVCSCRKIFPMAIVWWLFLLGFLVWTSHTLFAGLSMVLTDFCAEVSGMKNQQLNIVAPLIGCSDSLFSDFRSNFKKLEVAESEKACNSIKAVCYNDADPVLTNVGNGRLYRCPNPMNCPGLTFAPLVTWLQSEIYIHENITKDTTIFNQALTNGQLCSTPANQARCSIALCAEDCKNSDNTLSATGRKSKELYFTFAAAKNVSNVLDTLGARFSTCDTVLSLIISPFDPPCTELVDGMVAGRQSTGLVGLSIIAAIIVFAWGAKRFISISEANQPQREGMDIPDKED